MKHLFFTLFLFSINFCLGQSKLTDPKTECSYILPWNCDECNFNWTGVCLDNSPNGQGVLTVFHEKNEIMRYEGSLRNGSFDGVGKYVDSQNKLDGLFKDGNFISNDTTLLDNMEKVMVSKHDPHSLYINDGHSNTNLYYYKMLPEGKPKGVLTILPSGGETTENLIQQISIHKEAIKNGLIVIIPSINWGTDDRLPEISFLDTVFKKVVKEHKVSKNNFIFCGLSNGGMISFRYAINAVKDSNTFIVPKGIIGIDPPLDFARLYKYFEREIKRNFSPVGVGEAKWMIDNYNTVYGGSPDQFPQNFIDASTFSYGTKDGGNAKHLTDIAIRMHSDLNIDYLLNQRHRDLYDWNGTDIVAFVNQLKINGNKNAEVIITQNKGIRPGGMQHPHSWSIMETAETIEWILNLVKE